MLTDGYSFLAESGLFIAAEATVGTARPLPGLPDSCSHVGECLYHTSHSLLSAPLEKESHRAPCSHLSRNEKATTNKVDGIGSINFMNGCYLQV